MPSLAPRLPLLALLSLVPLVSLVSLAACAAPTGEDPGRADDAVTLSPIHPPIGPVFVFPTHFQASSGELTKLAPSAGNFCTLDGVSGNFDSDSTKATVVDDGTSFWLYASPGVSATAVCTPFTNFTGTNIVPSAAQTTTLSPYWATATSQPETGALLKMWGRNASCTLSTIGGNWGTALAPGQSQGPFNRVAIIPIQFVDPWELDLYTSEPYATVQANCFAFPAVTYLSNQGTNWVDPGQSLPLALTSQAFCGLGEIDGSLAGPEDGVHIEQSSGGVLTATITGSHVSAAGITCIYFDQTGS